MSIEAARFGTRKNSAINLAEQPIEIGKFFKNRKGDFVVVAIKEFQGIRYLDIRQFFTGDDGKSFPTKKGIAVRLHKLEELAGLINNAIAKAHELGLIREDGEP
jgi:hypothetical protein